MKAIKSKLASLSRDIRGATSIEYAILASLIAISFVLIATNLGGTISSLFKVAADKFA